MGLFLHLDNSSSELFHSVELLLPDIEVFIYRHQRRRRSVDEGEFTGVPFFGKWEDVVPLATPQPMIGQGPSQWLLGDIEPGYLHRLILKSESPLSIHDWWEKKANSQKIDGRLAVTFTDHLGRTWTKWSHGARPLIRRWSDVPTM